MSNNTHKRQLIITGAIFSIAALLGAYYALRSTESEEDKLAIQAMLNNPKNIDILDGPFDKNKPWLKFGKTKEEWIGMMQKCI